MVCSEQDLERANTRSCRRPSSNDPVHCLRCLHSSANQLQPIFHHLQGEEFAEQDRASVFGCSSSLSNNHILNISPIIDIHRRSRNMGMRIYVFQGLILITLTLEFRARCWCTYLSVQSRILSWSSFGSGIGVHVLSFPRIECPCHHHDLIFLAFCFWCPDQWCHSSVGWLTLRLQLRENCHFLEDSCCMPKIDFLWGFGDRSCCLAQSWRRSFSWTRRATFNSSLL